MDNKTEAAFATMQEALIFAGVRSRNTLRTWEDAGIFPKRRRRGLGRIGYPWDELFSWRDSRPTDHFPTPPQFVKHTRRGETQTG